MQAEHPALNLSEIAQGMIACRSNARELLAEFDALLAGRHFARAYALLHTACEELAKFSILELGGKRLAAGDPPNWKRFWRRFRSHDSKIAQLNVQLLYLMAESKNVVHRSVVEAVETLFDYGLVIRNSALYVEAGPDRGFRKPSDIDFSIPLTVLHTAAILALDVADRRGKSTTDIELNLQEPLHRSAQQIAMKILAKVISRAKDAGVERDEMANVLEKILGK